MIKILDKTMGYAAAAGMLMFLVKYKDEITGIFNFLNPGNTGDTGKIITYPGIRQDIEFGNDPDRESTISWDDMSTAQQAEATRYGLEQQGWTVVDQTPEDAQKTQDGYADLLQAVEDSSPENTREFTSNSGSDNSSSSGSSSSSSPSRSSGSSSSSRYSFKDFVPVPAPIKDQGYVQKKDTEAAFKYVYNPDRSIW